MATQIKITSGGLSASKDFTDDAKAQKIFSNFSDYLGVPSDATPQQRLQFILNWFVTRIEDGARAQAYAVKQSELQAQMDADSKLQ